MLGSTPSLSYFWNLGSFLGLIFGIQYLSGLLLAMSYTTTGSFDHLLGQGLNQYGSWVLHLLHVGGSSLIFVLLLMHIFKALMFSTSGSWDTWLVGVTLLLLIMAISFLGYVLPLNNMSLWAATVISSFLSLLPLPFEVPFWLWAGYSIGEATLQVFFSLHFQLPHLIFLLLWVHLACLHQSGSSSKLGLSNYQSVGPFYPYLIKDLLNLSALGILTALFLLAPHMFSSGDSFMPASSFFSPLHILPEWYFLPYYAILRCVPNKLGGLVVLVFSVLLLFPLFNLFSHPSLYKSVLSLLLFICLLILGVLGSCPAEYPFTEMSQVLVVLHFIFLLMMVAK